MSVVEKMGISGLVVVEVFDRPAALELIHAADELRLEGVPSSRADLFEIERELDGYLVSRETVRNLVTRTGDQGYGDAYAALCANATVAAPAGVTGMRLGTSNTAPAKTGAGSFIGAYVNNSAKAIDAGFPTSGLSGVNARRETWKTSWGAGVINGVALAEVAITNETPLTNVVGTAANTISRALIGPYTLDALAVFSVTWMHDLLGA